MKFLLLFCLLNSTYLFAYRNTTNCESEFSKKQWRTLQSAKTLMVELGIKTQRQFYEWSRSDQRPQDFPANPFRTYKTEWRGWREFLGTENISKKVFRNYESAKALMKDLGIKTRNQFREWSRSDQRPQDFPSNLSIAYKTEWRSWGEFLGTGNVNKKVFRGYASAKALMTELGIKTRDQFREWSRSDQKPFDFPSNPTRAYKTEWRSWGEFLGTGNVNKKVFRSYASAKALMAELGIKTRDQFRKWSRSGKRPSDFPSNPTRTYKEKWVSWEKFLGREKPKKWMSYRKGQRHVKMIEIRTVKELLEWLKSSERPEDFPPDPHIVWSKSWKTAQDFLTIRWMPFKKARSYVQQGGVTNKREYYEFRKSENLINELPPNPATVYAPYWKSWDDFFWG